MKLAYTVDEMNKAVLSLLTTDARTFKDATLDLGIPRKSFQRLVADILKILGVSTAKVCQMMVMSGRLPRKQIKYAVEQRETKDVGKPCYLSRDEEAIIIAVAEIKGAHSLPSSQEVVGEKLHAVLQNVGSTPEVQNKTKLAYARRVSCRINKQESEQVEQQKRSLTEEIKVRGLSHKRAKQSDPRLEWIMFHKMCVMHREVIALEKAHAEKSPLMLTALLPRRFPTGLMN